MDSELFMKVVRREVVDVGAVAPLLADARSRLLAFRLNVLEGRLKRLDGLVNPPVLAFSRSLGEDEVAQLHKNYYASRRNMLVGGFGRLIESFIQICDVMFTADPIVDVEVELTKNLQSTYKTVIALTEKVTDALANLVDVARYPDEVLKATGTLQTEWTNLLLTTQHIIVTPLKTAITEEARKELIGRVTQGFLGR